MNHKKKILIIFPGEMELGGVESSLLGLLAALDYEKYDVDLFLYGHHGALFPYIDKRANLLPEEKELAFLRESTAEKFKHGCWRAVALRIWADLKNRLGKAGPLEREWAKLVHWCDKLDKRYNLSICFKGPFDFMAEKVNADIKVGWIHTDYTGFNIDEKELRREYSQPDYIAAVSDDCKVTFSKLFPEFTNKITVIENILSKSLIETRSEEFGVKLEMPNDGSIKLLSIGRFSIQKNFDNIPDICKKILQMGIDVKWYLIGFGGDEEIIREKIAQANMEKYVIILGKKENPYPYIKRCDIYVQPSRYEGKSVAVREAQMLNKPVIITNYATSASQLIDGYDGVVVPMDNEGCAKGIANVIRDKELQNMLIENTKQNDYTNSGEVKKLYCLIENGL